VGPKSRSGRGSEKNSQPVPRLEPPIIQPMSTNFHVHNNCVMHFVKHKYFHFNGIS